jgi:hypothetical protein
MEKGIEEAKEREEREGDEMRQTLLNEFKKDIPQEDFEWPILLLVEESKGKKMQHLDSTIKEYKKKIPILTKKIQAMIIVDEKYKLPAVLAYKKHVSNQIATEALEHFKTLVESKNTLEEEYKVLKKEEKAKTKKPSQRLQEMKKNLTSIKEELNKKTREYTNEKLKEYFNLALREYCDGKESNEVTKYPDLESSWNLYCDFLNTHQDLVEKKNKFTKDLEIMITKRKSLEEMKEEKEKEKEEEGSQEFIKFMEMFGDPREKKRRESEKKIEMIFEKSKEKYKKMEKKEAQTKLEKLEEEYKDIKDTLAYIIDPKLHQVEEYAVDESKKILSEKIRNDLDIQLNEMRNELIKYENKVKLVTTNLKNATNAKKTMQFELELQRLQTLQKEALEAVVIFKKNLEIEISNKFLDYFNKEFRNFIEGKTPNLAEKYPLVKESWEWYREVLEEEREWINKRDQTSSEMEKIKKEISSMNLPEEEEEEEEETIESEEQVSTKEKIKELEEKIKDYTEKLKVVTTKISKYPSEISGLKSKAMVACKKLINAVVKPLVEAQYSEQASELNLKVVENKKEIELIEAKSKKTKSESEGKHFDETIKNLTLKTMEYMNQLEKMKKEMTQVTTEKTNKIHSLEFNKFFEGETPNWAEKDENIRSSWEKCVKALRKYKELNDKMNTFKKRLDEMKKEKTELEKELKE